MSIKDANKIKIRREKNAVYLIADSSSAKSLEKSARTLRKEAKYKARKKKERAEAVDQDLIDPKVLLRTTQASGYFTTCNTRTGKSKVAKWQHKKGDYWHKPTPLIKGEATPPTQATGKQKVFLKVHDKYAHIPNGGIKYKHEYVDKGFRTLNPTKK